MQTSFGQIHVDQALTNVSVAFTNPEFTIERILLPVPVQKQNDVYFVFSKQHFRSYEDTVRPGAAANRIPVDLDARGSYIADGHALEVLLTDEERKQADPGAQLEIEKTEKVTQSILLNEEIQGAAIVNNAANVPLNTTLAGTSKWSDYVNSDPIPVVDAAKETVQQAVGVMPNCFQMSRPVFRVLRNHPRVIDRVKYTGMGLREPLTPDQLAQAFDVDEIIISSALQQSNPEGEADALAYVWGNNALLFYRPKSPGLRIPAFGYTFLWVGEGVAYQVKRWRDESIDSEVIKTKKYYDQHLVANSAAYLFLSAI